MNIIALYSSRPQCGKSTAAQHLDNKHSFQVLKFAFPMKKMLGALLGEVLSPTLVTECLEGNLKEASLPQICGITPRRLMQTLGTEWGRNTLHEDFWVKIMDARLSRAPSRVVVDDMRFPNEFDMLKRRGALMVRIDRPLANPVDRNEGHAHASEGALDRYKFDYILDNDGTLEGFLASIDTLAAGVASCPQLHY